MGGLRLFNFTISWNRRKQSPPPRAEDNEASQILLTLGQSVPHMLKRKE
jgi:hypothetical protein